MFDRSQARAEAEKIQRERQQGFGKPIISAQLNGRRLVGVKNRLLQSKEWWTFEDFLCGYIKIALGDEWGNAEIAKPATHQFGVFAHRASAAGRKATSGLRGVIIDIGERYRFSVG
jgi:hypothetical protein